MKTLLELGMECVLAEYYNEFIISLFLEEIDVVNKTWSAETIDRNAWRGANMIHQIISGGPKKAKEFLQAILKALNHGSYLHAMAIIYIMFERWATYPAFSIVQHAIDEDLLREYCKILAECLTLFSRINDKPT